MNLDRHSAIADVISCELADGAHAVFTSRAAGNLSTMRGEGSQRGRQTREALCRELGLGWLCASRQVHGTSVQRVRSALGTGGQALELDADGHATSAPRLGMMVLVADCLPVALGSSRAVAMVHAGWRGLAAGVLEEGVRAVQELGGAREPLVAAIGPGAGPCCYEVGPEVHAAFGRADRARGNIDLPAIARARLLAAGAVRVDEVSVCTICDERFYSHRREGTRAGRQAGVAWLS